MASFGHEIKPAPISWLGCNVYGTCLRMTKRAFPRCQNPVKYVVIYSYKTGRLGRVSKSRQGRCEACAQDFAD